MKIKVNVGYVNYYVSGNGKKHYNTNEDTFYEALVIPVTVTTQTIPSHLH